MIVRRRSEKAGLLKFLNSITLHALHKNEMTKPGSEWRSGLLRDRRDF
jgi:hypothetical protein